MTKSSYGLFFEDFTLGMVIDHATPRTVTTGERALYHALYPSRFSLFSSDEVARKMGYRESPLDDLLVFHVVFGSTVPDISLNALVNLGYAECVFHKPVFAGDTLQSRSEVIGLKQNSSGESGVVYVRTTGTNQRGETVLSFVRWVMVVKRTSGSPASVTAIPELIDSLQSTSYRPVLYDNYDFMASGSQTCWEDYAVGEKIDHIDGVTIEEAEHMMATRLWQNTAKVHFNMQAPNKFNQRLIYGGHIISLVRSLSYNGLANAQTILGINGGTHCAPCFAGDTIYAWSEVLEKAPIQGSSAGALRLRSVGVKNNPADKYPYKQGEKAYQENVVLDLDYWVACPKRTLN
jgi:2-methylfumaryl-CoA hydratase